MVLLPIGFVAALAVIMAYWAFPRYAYEMLDDAVKMRRWIFRWLPFGTYTLAFSDIEAVERVSFFSLALLGAYIFGHPYSTCRALIILKPGRERFHLFWKVYVTPRDPEEFVRLLRQKIAAPPEAPAPAPSPARPGVTLWVTDALAILSFASVPAVAVALWLPHSTPARIGLWIGGPLITVMWVSMYVDCLVQGARHPAEGKRLLRWVGVIVIVFPGPWVYYLFEKRRRRAQASPS